MVIIISKSYEKNSKADTPTFVSLGLCHIKSMYSLVTIGIKTAPINTSLMPSGLGRCLARFCHVCTWVGPSLCACPNLDFHWAWTKCRDSSYSVLWETRGRKHIMQCPISRGQGHLVAINLILMAKRRCQPSCPGLLASSGGNLIWIWLFIIFYIKSSFTFLCVTCSEHIASYHESNSKWSQHQGQVCRTPHLCAFTSVQLWLRAAFVDVGLLDLLDPLVLK